MSSPSQGSARHWLRPTALALGSLAALGLAACLPVISDADQAPALMFRDGGSVRAAQALLRVDLQPFDATVARARADLKVARAREQLAASEAERARLLYADRSISAEVLERHLAAHAQAQAQRAAAESALQTAQLEHDCRSASS
jgi:multidrug efflux pump subunit AcrA (membrane-fusion protein)